MKHLLIVAVAVLIVGCGRPGMVAGSTFGWKAEVSYNEVENKNIIFAHSGYPSGRYHSVEYPSIFVFGCGLGGSYSVWFSQSGIPLLTDEHGIRVRWSGEDTAETLQGRLTSDYETFIVDETYSVSVARKLQTHEWVIVSYPFRYGANETVKFSLAGANEAVQAVMDYPCP